MEQFTCSVCGRTLSADQFYKIHYNKKYYKDRCKDCICKDIENGGLDRNCRLMDIPLIYDYIDYQYQNVKRIRNGEKPTIKQWFGRYVAYMNLWSFQSFRYGDSERLNALREVKRVTEKFRKEYGVLL